MSGPEVALGRREGGSLTAGSLAGRPGLAAAPAAGRHRDALETARLPRTTVQTPFRWSEDESWREVYARVDERNREALRKEGEARRALQAAKGG